MSAFRRCRLAGAALAILLLGGCSLPEATEGIVNGYDPDNANINDPFESQNRSIYALNDYADRTVFRPVASAYVKAAPAPARSCLDNIFDNLKEPIRTVAHLISFDDAAAASSSSRFLVNTIGGGFGCVDVAGEAMGIEEEEGDIGLSVRSWLDNEHSVYLMMPLFGPTTLIDGSMRYAGTAHLDPLVIARSRRDDFHKEDRHWMSRNPYDITEKSRRQATYILRGVDGRAEALDASELLDEISFDHYLSVRHFYLEQRRRQSQEIAERRREKFERLF